MSEAGALDPAAPDETFREYEPGNQGSPSTQYECQEQQRQHQTSYSPKVGTGAIHDLQNKKVKN
jgi:hypothetical protein